MKYKGLYIKSMVTRFEDKPYAYFLWRRKIVLRALKTLYFTNDMRKLWCAIEILNNEIRKAKRENFTRITGGRGWK